jgi:protein SCO1
MKKHLARLVTTTSLIALATGLSACTESKHTFRAVDITGASYAQGFALPDAQGKPRSLADFAGKVVVVFFGYTQCPDVCPTTLAELAEVKRVLGPQGDKVQGVFVSLDPERDTREVLAAYVDNFGQDFVALRADTPEALAAVAKEFKIFYKKVPGKTAGSYTLDHTAASHVFDAKGKIRLYTRYGSGAQALIEDIRALLAE